VPDGDETSRLRVVGASQAKGTLDVCHDRKPNGHRGGPAVHGPGHPEAELEALRARVAATRWPDQELVADHSQGPKLTVMQELARFWASEYDWRRCEAKLNALPHFLTEIDGLDVHFIHVRSAHENALPIIITHGWPGSVIELLAVIDPLTNPTAHGASAADAFDVVIPSMPGYGYSGKPRETGWGPGAHRPGLDRAGHRGGWRAHHARHPPRPGRGRKLDRGAQFVALGVILILVAAGVGMFVYADTRWADRREPRNRNPAGTHQDPFGKNLLIRTGRGGTSRYRTKRSPVSCAHARTVTGQNWHLRVKLYFEIRTLGAACFGRVALLPHLVQAPFR